MTKTIGLSDEAHDRLSALKEPGESFSEVTLRLVGALEQDRILELAGAWDLDDESSDRMKERIREERDRSDADPVDVP